MGKYDDAEKDAFGKQKKEAWVSNAGGECAVSGCKQYATATNAVTGLKYAKWYCTPHCKALGNGANYMQINIITQRMIDNPKPVTKHWSDRLVDGVSKEQLVADDKAAVNWIHDMAKL